MENESKEGEKPDGVGVQLCRWRNGMVAWALHESFLISSNQKSEVGLPWVHLLGYGAFCQRKLETTLFISSSASCFI